MSSNARRTVPITPAPIFGSVKEDAQTVNISRRVKSRNVSTENTGSVLRETGVSTRLFAVFSDGSAGFFRKMDATVTNRPIFCAMVPSFFFGRVAGACARCVVASTATGATVGKLTTNCFPHLLQVRRYCGLEAVVNVIEYRQLQCWQNAILIYFPQLLHWKIE